MLHVDLAGYHGPFRGAGSGCDAILGHIPSPWRTGTRQVASLT